MTNQGALGISDEAVREKTGRDWTSWLTLIDRADGKNRSHKELASWLASEHGLDGWWAQSVTVRYEQERKGRKVGATSDGWYQLGVSKTMLGEVEDVLDHFVDDARRTRLLKEIATRVDGDGGRFRRLAKARWEQRVYHPGNRVRFRVEGAEAEPITIQIYAGDKGDGKIGVTVHLERLPDEQAREDYRIGWRNLVDQLA